MDVNIISGKAYWASITAPNTTYEPVWCVDVCLDEDSKKKVESLGLAVQNKVMTVETLLRSNARSIRKTVQFVHHLLLKILKTILGMVAL